LVRVYTHDPPRYLKEGPLGLGKSSDLMLSSR
jgi:hypothetical protein